MPPSPDLMFAEVANLLRKKCRRGEMDPATAQIAMSWLARLSEAPLVTADRRFHARCQAADAHEWRARLRLLGTD